MRVELLFCLAPFVIPLAIYASIKHIPLGFQLARTLQKPARSIKRVLLWMFVLLVIFIAPSGGYTGNTLTFVNGIFFAASCVFLLLWLTKRTKRATALLITSVLLLLCAATVIMRDAIPQNILARCTIEEVNRSLQAYYAANGHYPGTLNSIRDPAVFQEQPEFALRLLECQSRWKKSPLYAFNEQTYAEITTGATWLYLNRAQSYALGLFYYPRWLGWLGPRICLYQSADSTITCRINNWGLFAESLP